MHFLLDIAVILVLIGSILLCYYRGIIHTLVSFAGNIICILASLFLGDALAKSIYDDFLSKQIVDSISDSLKNSSYDGITSIEKALNNLPSMPKDLLAVFGHTPKTMSKGITLDLANNYSSIAATIERLLRPICISVISFIVICIFFIAFRFLFHFLIRVIDRATDLPLLRTANKWAGGVFGIVNGLLLIYFLVGVFSLIFPFIAGDGMTYAQFDELARGTNFYSFFYIDNMITAFFM